MKSSIIISGLAASSPSRELSHRSTNKIAGGLNFRVLMGTGVAPPLWPPYPVCNISVVNSIFNLLFSDFMHRITIANIIVTGTERLFGVSIAGTYFEFTCYTVSRRKS